MIAKKILQISPFTHGVTLLQDRDGTDVRIGAKVES